MCGRFDRLHVLGEGGQGCSSFLKVAESLLFKTNRQGFQGSSKGPAVEAPGGGGGGGAPPEKNRVFKHIFTKKIMHFHML